MKGALYHLAFGQLEIGSYIDTDGRTQIVMRGQVSLDNIDKIANVLASVVACSQYAHPLEELKRTDPLFFEHTAEMWESRHEGETS